MRRRRHQRGAQVVCASLIVSGAVHALVSIPVRDSINAFFSEAGREPSVRVVQLSAEQWSQNLRTKSKADAPRNPLLDSKPAPAQPETAEKEAAKAAEPPKPEPPKPEEKLNGQIVEVPPTDDESPNPEAKYLSKYNSHAKKESVARMEERDPRLKRVTNKLQRQDQAEAPPENAVKTPGLTVRGDGMEEDKQGKPTEHQFVLKVPDILRRDSVKVKPGVGEGIDIGVHSGSDGLRGNSDKLDIQMGSSDRNVPGEDGGKKGPLEGSDTNKSLPTLSALVPNLGTIARISGSPSMDYVEGVPEGEGTFLNTKEFKYATFFYRVRDSVADHWMDLAALEYRRRDPTGQIYGVRDRATLLRIQLNKQGELDDVHVEQTSGVDFLDRVAIEAFKKAQPFPNPPAGIMDDDGRIRFNFQFVITMNPNRGLNIFRNYR